MTHYTPYNPLDRINLAESVARALLERPVVPLGSIERFLGAGIYAIYYTGPHDLYSSIAEKNRDGRFESPIYCGKAIPKGGRKGKGVLAETAQSGTALWDRLKEHADTIRTIEAHGTSGELFENGATPAATGTIKLADFFCRFITVDEVWIPLSESLMIATYSPIWNVHLDGFGNHDPGSGRYNGKRPPWDVVHPGRGWAFKCKDNKTAEEFSEKVRTALAFNSELIADNDSEDPNE